LQLKLKAHTKESKDNFFACIQDQGGKIWPFISDDLQPYNPCFHLFYAIAQEPMFDPDKLQEELNNIVMFPNILDFDIEQETAAKVFEELKVTIY